MVTSSSEEEVEVVVAFGPTDEEMTRLTIPAGGGYAEYNLTPKTDPIRAYLDESEARLNRSLHIYTPERKTPFSCYAYIEAGSVGATARDASMLLPVHTLGKEYVIQTYPQDGKCTEFAVVATEDETTVFIVPSANTFNGVPAGGQIQMRLSRGQSLLVSSKQNEVGQTQKDTLDMSGSTICADKPVAVFSANEAVKIPMDEAYSDDYALEQIPPISGMGKEFYIGRSDRQNMFCCVTALYDNTEVTESRWNAITNRTISVTTTLHALQSLPVRPPLNNVITNIVIRSTRPVLCQTYFTSAANNSTTEYDDEGNPVVRNWSDPSGAILTSWEQRVQDMTFYTKELSTTTEGEVQYHYVQVTIPKTEIDSLLLDGQAVNKSLFTAYGGNEDMVYASLPITSHGKHQLTTSGEGFLGFIYGYAAGMSYLYTLGYRPNAHPDSLYITDSENVMSPRSYDLQRMQLGWYQRQEKEWPAGEQRLDTAIVCDSTTLHFAVQTDLTYEKFKWEVWDIEPDTIVWSEEVKTTDALQKWEHIMAVSPDRDIAPEKRKPYTDYRIYAMPMRPFAVCPEDSLYADTLKSVVRVLRAYNDTTRRIICSTDTIRFFNDSVYNYAPAMSWRSNNEERNDSTVFVADTTRLGRGQHRQRSKYLFNCGLGFHRFTRQYESQLGCDSLVIFELYINPSPDTTRIDTFIGHDHLPITFPTGENVLFSGQTFREPGMYIDHLTALSCEDAGFTDTLFSGCDSVIQLRVHLRDTLETFFCDSTDNPTEYKVDWGDFVWTGHLINADGEDNIVRDVTSGKDLYAKDIAGSIPVGTTHEFHDYYQTADGCDSNYVLILTRQPVEIVRTVVNRPNNLTYVWRYGTDEISGQQTIVPNPTWIDTTVYRQQTVKLPNRCPIIFLLEVTFREIKLIQRDESICDVDTIAWRNRIYAGYKYRDKYPGAKFTPTQTFTSGYYELIVDSFKTIPTREYYDSLYYLTIRVSPSYTRYDTLYLCDNETVEWNGMVFAGAKAVTKAEVYKRFAVSETKYSNRFVFPTVYGCDSTCNVVFYIRPSYLTDKEVTICGDEDYVWTGHSDSSRPIYNAETGRVIHFGKGRLWQRDTEARYILTDSLHTSSCEQCDKGACDSIYRLTLTIHPAYGPITLDTIVCRSKNAFVWLGHKDPLNPTQDLHLYHDTIGYIDTLTTINQCDSITVLNLRFFDDDVRSYDTTVCQTSRPFLMGTTGIYFTPADSTVGTHVYDTYVYQEQALHCPYREVWTVTVSPVYYGDLNAAYRTTDTICRDTANRYYTWNDHLYTDASETSYRTLYTADGKAIQADRLPMDVPGSYIYYDSLTTRCPSCPNGGCDSIWVLHLEVMPSYYHTFRHQMSDEEIYTWEGTTYGGIHALAEHNITVWGDTIIESHHPLQTGTVTCDSTVVFNLRIGKVYRDTTYDFVCENCSYTWQRTITEDHVKTICEDVRLAAGETRYFSDPYETYLGFDSVFVLALTGMPTYHQEDTLETCQDLNSYIWEGHPSTSHRLFVNGEPISNISVTDTGWIDITDSLTTQALFVDPHGLNTRPTGCDSVWLLHLYVHPTYNSRFHSERVTDEDGLCSNLTYLWHRTLYVGADYDLAANPINETTEDYDRVVYLTDQHLQNGLYEDSLLGETVHGCDSILYLHLNLYRRAFTMRYDTIGDNDTIWQFGHGNHIVRGQDFHVSDYTDPNRPIRKFFYIDTLTTVNGCDSIVHDSLVVAPTYRFVDTIVTCGTDLIDWRKYENVNYLPSGFYYDSLYTSYYHVDSTYVLDLTVIPNFQSIQTQYMCKNDTLHWQHKDIFYQTENENDITTQYIATYVKPGACDSTYELNVTYFNYYHLPADTDSVCRYDTYHWMTGGIEHTRALRDEKGNPLRAVPTDTIGWITVYDSLKTLGACQCDSTFTLRLYVKPAYYFYDTIDICSNETAYWHNREYHSEIAQDLHDEINYGTIENCDSIYYLCVHVHQAYYYDDARVICASALPYTWEGHGQTINLLPSQAQYWSNDSTFYLTDSCQTIHGCDSVYHHRVTIVPIRHTWLRDTICVGDTLTFHHHRLTSAGLYTDTLTNQWGCDSLVSLMLATVPVTHLSVQRLPAVCADDRSFDITYSYQGISPVAYRMTFNEEAVEQGFVNTEWLTLRPKETTISVPLPVYDSYRHYARPNNYTATIFFDNGYCLDSTLLAVPIAFSLRYPSWILEQHWNDVIGILTDSLNDGYHFYAFQWYKNDELMPGETKPYLYCPQYLEEDAVYSVALTRSSDSLTFMSCALTPDLSRPQELTPQDPYIAVVPTLVVHENPVVNILCVNPGTYSVYDPFGSLHTSGTFTPGEHNAYEVRLPSTTGVYLFHLYESSGLERTVKVIVH